MADRPDYFAHVLPDLVRETNWLKEMGVWTTLARYFLTIAAGATVVVRVEPPERQAWYIDGETHGNIPLYVFRHGCVKDGKEILPEQLIGCSNLHIQYTVPVVMKEYFEGTLTNTDAVDHDFELVLHYAVVPAEYVPPFASPSHSSSADRDPPRWPSKARQISEKIRRSWSDEGFPKGTTIRVYYQDEKGRRYLALRKVTG